MAFVLGNSADAGAFLQHVYTAALLSLPGLCDPSAQWTSISAQVRVASTPPPPLFHLCGCGATG